MRPIQRFFIHDPKDIPDLAEELAEFFPQPAEVATAIHELLLNAVEHGNLDIGFEAKSELLRLGRWADEISRRLALPENAQKKVEIKVMESENKRLLEISDQGKGFAVQAQLQQPAPLTHPHGRGLMVAMHSGFDSIGFNAAGNRVTCVADMK